MCSKTKLESVTKRFSRIGDPVGELSGGRWLHTFDKGGAPRLRQWSSCEPLTDADKVEGCGGEEMLKLRLRAPNISCPA
jgi:hypothetical protein